MKASDKLNRFLFEVVIHSIAVNIYKSVLSFDYQHKYFSSMYDLKSTEKTVLQKTSNHDHKL